MHDKEPDPKPIRAVIYCRVSTEDQAKEGFSLAAQEERLRAYCLAKGWRIVRTFVDDGYSGRSDDRPAYREMMGDKSIWDVMVVLKMDRIHRNSKNFTLMMEELKREGKEFTSMQESFDTTTAMGRFVMDIIQRIAQLESEQIGERVYVGMQQKAKEAKGILGFAIPLGYSISNGSLEIMPSEAEIVKYIFSMYMKGDNLRMIADMLNASDMRTKSGKAKWHPSTIHKVLSNPIYCGYHRWDDIVYKGKVDPIISVKEFDEVQTRLHKKVPKKMTRMDEGAPLSVVTA